MPLLFGLPCCFVGPPNVPEGALVGRAVLLSWVPLAWPAGGLVLGCPCSAEGAAGVPEGAAGVPEGAPVVQEGAPIGLQARSGAPYRRRRCPEGHLPGAA